jgi:hypothetical protein
VFQVRPLTTVGAAALCLGVVLAGLGGGTAGGASSGSLATTTTVSAVPTTQPYGVPGQEFVVNVTSSAAPTGTVAVSSGGQQLCTNLALNPVGSTDTSSAICVDTGDTLAVTATVIALYSPDTATFAPSKGKASGVVVAASTSASLSTSNPTGTWGAEQGIVFTGSVTNTESGSTGTPTGTITVEQGATVICTIQLPSGSSTGTCTPGPTGLAPGTDEAVTAIYDGDTNFSASAASAPVTETIVEAAATVTANGQTMVYGGGVPALTTTVSGLVAGQTLATSGISGQAACTTTATGASAVGAYPITCSVGTLSSSDYAFSFAPGTLTISQAATTTSVNVSASTVTVSVAPQFSGSPPGTVAVNLGGTSASCTLAPQANGPSNCSVPVPTSLAAGTYPVTASYGANADFAGSSGTGQLVVAASSTGSGSSSSGSSGGGTSGNPGTAGGSGSSGSSGGTTSIASGGVGSANGVTGPYQTPQQLLAIDAAEVALQEQMVQQAQHESALGLAAMNAFLNALHNLKGGSSLAEGLTGATSGSTHGQAAGPGVRSSNGAHSGGSRSSGGGTGTGNGSSSNPTTVNLVASQSKPASPEMTALLLGLLVLALVVVAMVARRRNALRARALVASAGDDEGAE